MVIGRPPPTSKLNASTLKKSLEEAHKIATVKNSNIKKRTSSFLHVTKNFK